MSFFIKGKQANSAKRAKFSNQRSKKRKPTPSKVEEVTSSEEDDLDARKDDVSSSEDENETAQEKKLRLAKIYLQEIEKEEKARLEKDEVDRSVISKRLKEDHLKESGRLRITVADRYKQADLLNSKVLKCKQQRGSITCLCLSSDSQHAFVGSKDGTIVKYCLNDCKKVGIIPYVKQNNGQILGHSSEIFSIAVSTDGKFLCVGDRSGNIQIWDPSTLRHLKTLTGHKNSVFGLCFKKESHTLYSCSKDKTIKVWNLDEMSYVESLFGHQDMVASIDALYRDRVVTSGGRDIRIWKISEETQLIYNGHLGNIDNVKLISEENFATAGDDGQICIWSVLRKKPLQCIENAHGRDPSNNQPNWITALCSLKNTDLIASGSCDGFVRLWRLDDGFKSSSELFKIEVEGVINALEFTPNGQKLLVAVGRDYKLGRWTVMKQVKNCVMIIPFMVSK